MLKNLIILAFLVYHPDLEVIILTYDNINYETITVYDYTEENYSINTYGPEEDTRAPEPYEVIRNDMRKIKSLLIMEDLFKEAYP